jgi:hypothetical protein
VAIGSVWQLAQDARISSWPHAMGFAVLPDGSIGGLHHGIARAGTPTPAALETALVCLAFYAGLATTFCHCHNVGTTEHHPSRQQRRFRERRGQPPLVSWRTIDILPVTQLLSEQGGLDQHGLAHALHLVRANFAHYTEERPLFGKYVGTFYRPQHVRGRDRERLSGHDYRVHRTAERLPPTGAEEVHDDG